MNTLADKKATQAMIAALKDYSSKNWAVGLTWPHGQPDHFTSFFNARGLTCVCDLAGDFSVGAPSAYERDIATLTQYIARIVPPELAACKKTLAGIADYKSRNWAIGLGMHLQVHVGGARGVVGRLAPVARSARQRRQPVVRVGQVGRVLPGRVEHHELLREGRGSPQG